MLLIHRKIIGSSSKNIDLINIVYPNKFTLLMESKVPDKLEPGLYYVCGNDFILKYAVEQYVINMLKQTFAIPVGFERTNINIDRFFIDYISKSFKISCGNYNQVLSTGFNNLRIPESKMDYYYSRNIKGNFDCRSGVVPKYE